MMNSLRARSEFTPSAKGANSSSQTRRNPLGSNGPTAANMSVSRSLVSPKVWTAVLRS